MKKGTTLLLVILMLVTSLPAFAQAPVERGQARELPGRLADLKLEAPVELGDLSIANIDASLFATQGANKVIIRLVRPSVAEQGLADAAAARERDALRQVQADLLGRVRALDPNARVIAQTQIVLNAVFVEVDAAVLPQLAKDPAVLRIAPVGNYELDLSETVPYIGASAVQARGFTGRGVKVAVLDSGIDYTHVAFGGSGNPVDYAANDPTIIEPGTFPTAKVVGGYDFVGGVWPNGPEMPDPDPLDDGPAGGHGTHVADIIGGKMGVAPGVSLYAVKVCSSVSTSCSGIALIQGMEFAVNPNGDGRLNDRVNIINMSLGSSYGQPFDDDLSLAVENATKVGILTVASAGNSSDKPYANGTPAAAPSALSVAQTAVPSAFLPLMQILAPANIAGNFPAVFQPWSAPLTTAIEAPLQFGNGAGGNTLGCNSFPAGSLAGKIVLVNRGTCSFSIKIANIAAGGGLLGIIGLVAPGDPFEGGYGGGDASVPGYMVSQAVANRLRAGLPNTVVRFDPAVGIPLAGSMVGSSSRGPQHEDTTLIKPEIGAPGASVSAIYGTGAGTGPFGGTSGAAPMVSGSAALLIEGYGGAKTSAKGAPAGRAIGHGLKPIELKALLMNNGETNVVNDPLTGALAPITRIGGGEVRVDRALMAPVAAWDDAVPSGSLSFGFVDVANDMVTLTKTIRVRNYDNTRRTYTVTPTFRFDNDVTNGAVSVSAPASVTVMPGLGRDTLFTITMTIDGAKLRGNFMNSGSAGADPATLTTNEYDGYLVLDDGKQPIRLAWHVLPRKAARVVPDTTELVPGGFPQTIGLNNTGVGAAQNDAYALLAVSDNLPQGGLGEQSPTPDIRAVGINTFPAPAGFCSANPSFLWAFAINTWERQQHLLPVSHQVWLDTNRDGTDDYVILNRDASGLGTISDGRQLSWVLNLATGAASAFFFAEHATNTGNTVLYICGEQIGMNAANLGVTQVDMDVLAQDFYYGGPGDLIEGLVVTPLGERFYGKPKDLAGKSSDPAGLTVYDFGHFPGNSPELGLLLFTNGDRSAGKRGGATQDAEAQLFRYTGFDLTLLHTNDFHARVDEYNVNGARCKPADATAGNCIGGAPRLATAVNAIRNSQPNVLLLDAGDQFQGTLFFNLFKGAVLNETMNYLGYDVMAIGNHEFDSGPAVFADFIEGAKFPVVGANINASADAHLAGKIAPYAVVERGGHKIGVIGITTPETENISSPGPNVKFNAPAASLQAAANALQAQGINKIIALTHVGYSEDLLLAAQVSGVDVIIGGHSHTFLYSPVASQTFSPPNLALTPAGAYPTVRGGAAPVLVASAYQWGTFLGNLNVSFDANGVLKTWRGNPIYMSRNVAKDAMLDAKLDPYRAAVANLITTPVGETTVSLPISVGGKRICRLGECLMGNLVADAMLAKANEFFPGANYQIAFQNGGGLRAPIAAGQVTMGDVMETLPFGNAIATMELEGKYVKAALENGARLYPSENGAFSQVAGLKYVIDPTQAVGSRITSVQVWNGTAWEPLETAKMYKVVTNDFMRRGGDNYLMFRDFAVNPYDFGPALDEALADYFRANSPVTPVIEGRITGVPVP